jgi:hypothetical protein
VPTAGRRLSNHSLEAVELEAVEGRQGAHRGLSSRHRAGELHHVPGLDSRHARERLEIEGDEIDGGHHIMLSRPLKLAERLPSYVAPS